MEGNPTSTITRERAGVSVFGRGVYLGLRLISGASRKGGASAFRIRCDVFGQRDAFSLVFASGVGIPFLIISVAFAIRVRRVSSLLASLIQRQYSLR